MLAVHLSKKPHFDTQFESNQDSRKSSDVNLAIQQNLRRKEATGEAYSR